MIMRDLIDLAHAADELQQAPDIRFGHERRPAMSRTRGGRNRSDAGKERADATP